MTMLPILRKAAVVTVVATAATLAIVAAVIPTLGGSLDGVALVLSILCPVVVGFPFTFYTFLQSERLARAHRDLLGAHAALNAAHARLAEKARRDDMTGMLNRQGFFDALARARSRGAEGSLLIVDADHFKVVNDGYGHLVGDMALHAICSALKEAVRAEDLVGRIGGEEFAVFLSGADHDRAAGGAERIRARVEAIEFSPGPSIRHRLTVSIGGAACRPGMELSDVLRAADQRLYEAKRRGRNMAVVEPGIGAAA